MRTVRIVWYKQNQEKSAKKKSLAIMMTLIDFEEWGVRNYFGNWNKSDIEVYMIRIKGHRKGIKEKI